MSKEQIEEMAHDICESRKANFADGCRVCNHHKNGCLYQDIACDLFMLGYRKQEWISVEERLPEENVRVLVCLQDDAKPFTHIDTDRRLHGEWVRWVTDITHWMPLPAPPKGGEG